MSVVKPKPVITLANQNSKQIHVAGVKHRKTYKSKSHKIFKSINKRSNMKPKETQITNKLFLI